jgi:hypothetical protein
MSCGSPSVECRAAEAWLNHSAKWVAEWHQREEVEKLRAQVAELTERAAQSEMEGQQ